MAERDIRKKAIQLFSNCKYESKASNMRINTFITYLYKEHIRKFQECDISLRFHYSLVFDLSPTLRQIASIKFFFVTRNVKRFSVYLMKQWHRTKHYRSIVITLLISDAIINSSCGAMDMVLAFGARGSAFASSSEHQFYFSSNIFLFKWNIEKIIV